MDGHTPNETLIKRWSRWNPQEGYSDKAHHVSIPHGEDVEKVLENETLPRYYASFDSFGAKTGRFFNSRSVFQVFLANHFGQLAQDPIS